jgi:pimeloyl-ACP methyl ester carboxylesterase
MTKAYSSDGRYFNDEMFYKTFYPNQDNYKGQVAILHGFPGWVTKNYDVAEVLSLSGYLCYVPHHVGTGLSKGSFNFIKSRNWTGDFLNFLRNLNPGLPLTVIGHSWGGYLALYHSSLCNHKLFLMAPLATFPQGEKLKQLTQGLITEASSDCTEYTIDSLYEEFLTLEKDLDFEIINNNPLFSKIYLFKATKDSVITPDLLELLEAKIPKDLMDVITFSDDHLLSKRRIVMHTFLQNID